MPQSKSPSQNGVKFLDKKNGSLSVMCTVGISHIVLSTCMFVHVCRRNVQDHKSWL